MSDSSKKYLVGIFDDDEVLVKGVREIRKAGVKIHEAFTPFPVHHLDEALGYKYTRLPKIAFVFGLTGTSLALLMQFYMLGIDWPMIIGGKPFTPLPTFIPVTFELTVLISALGMVATFLIVSDLKPYKKPQIFDIRTTDDKFAVAVELDKNPNMSSEDISSVLRANGAFEVNTKEFE